MYKLNFDEFSKLDSDSKKEFKQKATDKLIAENKAVFDAIQQIDTDLDNLAKKSGDEFRKAIKEFHKLLQGLDTRGINKVELLPSTDTYITTTDDPNKKWARAENFSVERLQLYNHDIRFKVTSSNGGWSCPITIVKTTQRPSTQEWAREGDMEWIPSYERKFDKLDIPVTFDAFNTTAKEDADAFVKNLNIGSFTNFMNDINKINEDYRSQESVLNTQGKALYSRIVKLQSQSEDDIYKHLKKLVTTDGLTTPKNVKDSWYGSKGKFIITRRSNGEDGYLKPHKLKVKTNSWEYYDELECELTFTSGSVSNKILTKTTTLQLPKEDVKRWMKELFIIKHGDYSHSYKGELSYYDNSLNALEHLPLLNTSPDSAGGYGYCYNLNGNKKERALRDSLGEWVEEAQTEQVEA